MTLAIGSDHAGFAYKEAIKAMLQAEGHTVRDFGTDSEAPCDYPDFIRPVAEAVARGEFERGIRHFGFLLAQVMLALVLIAIVWQRLGLAQEQLARQSAERANHAKSQFVTALSHELRTPLQAIIGFTENLKTLELSPEQRKELQIHEGEISPGGLLVSVEPFRPGHAAIVASS